MAGPAVPRARRGFAATGALCCSLAIALAAYAAHGLEATVAARLQLPLGWLLLHGFALAVFAPRQRNAWELAALIGWSGGLLLFCGSLICAVLFGTSTRLAPAGGVLLIVAWLVQALAALRR